MNGVTPLVWMRALRDDPDVTGTRLLVLWALGLRMRHGRGRQRTGAGTGWAPQAQLVDDARVSESTVRRVLHWAMDAGYLVRTKRGHRRGDGVRRASEYLLTLPSQPVTCDRLTVAESHSESLSDRSVSTGQTMVSTGQTSVSTGHQRRVKGSGFKGSYVQEGDLSVGLSPDGDGRDTPPNGETGDPLQDPTAEPFKVGMRLGQLVASGELEEGDEHVEIRDRFGHDTPDERAAWAGFDRGRGAQDVPETYEAILDDLRPLTAEPFKVGQRAAELFHDGAPLWRETFECLLHDLFGRDDNVQRQAWAGYHRHGGHRYTDKYCDDCGHEMEPNPDRSGSSSLYCPQCIPF